MGTSFHSAFIQLLARSSLDQQHLYVIISHHLFAKPLKASRLLKKKPLQLIDSYYNLLVWIGLVSYSNAHAILHPCADWTFIFFEKNGSYWPRRAEKNYAQIKSMIFVVLSQTMCSLCTFVSGDRLLFGAAERMWINNCAASILFKCFAAFSLYFNND